MRQSYSEAELATGYSPLLQFDVKDVAELVPRLLMLGAASASAGGGSVALDGAIEHAPHATIASLRAHGHMVTLVEHAEGAEGEAQQLR